LYFSLYTLRGLSIYIYLLKKKKISYTLYMDSSILSGETY
jgi:hypothetical protein